MNEVSENVLKTKILNYISACISSFDVDTTDIMSKGYKDGYLDGYADGIKTNGNVPSADYILKMNNLIVEYTTNILVQKNNDPIIKEFLEKDSKIENKDNKEYEEFFTRYMTKYIQTHWNDEPN